jgi:hypothetical protein
MEFGKVYNQKDTLYYDGFVKIYETALATTASAVTISGLNGDVDVEYKLKTNLIGTAVDYFTVHFNGDTTVGNYGKQRIYGLGASIGAERATAEGGIEWDYSFTVGGNGMNEATIYAKTGYPRTLITSPLMTAYGSTVNCINIYGFSWANTTNNLTSISIDSNVGIGSHISLYAKRGRL